MRTVSAIATAFLLVAFMATGYVLALNEERSVSPNRVVRMFARGVLLPNEPVEVTGTIQGGPEVAPDGFYLTLRAERIRSKDGEHDASGEVFSLTARLTLAASAFESARAAKLSKRTSAPALVAMTKKP